MATTEWRTTWKMLGIFALIEFAGASVRIATGWTSHDWIYEYRDAFQQSWGAMSFVLVCGLALKRAFVSAQQNTGA